jgi:hypothetical protein
MHAEDAAGSVLSEIINGTPKAGQIEIALVKANNEQIGMFLSEEMKYRLYLPPLYNRAFRANSMLSG